MFNKIKIELIEEYQKCLKLWSVRFFILIGIAPDLYSAMSSLGFFDDHTPPGLVWLLRGLATAGIASRLVKQQQIRKERHDGDTNNN